MGFFYDPESEENMSAAIGIPNALSQGEWDCRNRCVEPQGQELRVTAYKTGNMEEV
jgi:hypothetical protein